MSSGTLYVRVITGRFKKTGILLDRALISDAPQTEVSLLRWQASDLQRRLTTIENEASLVTPVRENARPPSQLAMRLRQAAARKNAESPARQPFDSRISPLVFGERTRG